MARPFSRYRAIPEAVALDAANDVLALSQEGRARLVQAHSAHVQDDWAKYLDAVDRINTAFTDIRDVARRWADDVMAAPEIAPNQLPLRLAA